MTIVDLDQALFFIYPDINVLKEKYPTCSSTKELLNASLKGIREFFGSDKEYKEYFWHDEGIHWEIMDKSSHPFISGKIKFGDGMEDEWFILKLLLKLSAMDTSLIASIFDTDGDFVLIEAAEVLPEWLEPETSKNRVLIHEGTIKIIPISLQKDQPQLHESLKLLRTGKSDSALNLRIMKSLEPKLLEEQKLHKAKVMVPLEIAKVLKMKKQLIGPAVSSFYNREDGSALKLSLFKNQQTFITTVPMTRIQFAQLACQELESTGNGTGTLGFDNPIAAELGMKLTFGFEILLSSEKKFIEKFDDSISILSVQDDIRRITKENSSKDPDEFIIEEQEDSLEWMEIDETVLDSNLQTKLEQLQMTEMEQSELIETWTKEFEGGNGPGKAKLKEGISEIDEIVEKMKKMIESTSNFEGIEPRNEDCDCASASDSEDSVDSEDSDNFNSDNFNSEDDEDLIEREIFETINFDPDLLMKIVESNSRSGVSSEEFLTRFRKYQDENPGMEGVGVKTGRQKGMADIDEGKIEEARKSSRKIKIKIVEEDLDVEEGSFDDDEDVELDLELDEKDVQNLQNVSDIEDIEVTDEFIYGQTFDQFTRASNAHISESESESEESANMEDYYSAMDNELSSSLLTTADSKLPAHLTAPEIQTNLGKNLIESMAAGGSTSPIETIVTGMGMKVPKPETENDL